jgi:hypothetical protein
LRTASTFECLPAEPFEREAPLLERRGLPLDLAFDFEAFGFAFEAFAFEAGFADFDAEVLFDFGFGFEFGVDLDFV